MRRENSEKKDLTNKQIMDGAKTILTTGMSLLFMAGCARVPTVSVPPFSDSFVSENSKVSQSQVSEVIPTEPTGRNIIFIQADQLAAGSLNCYGGGVESSPTLDSLSEQGTRFDRVYAINPVCAPNRANMLTSRSYQVHGVNTNNVPLKEGALTFAGALRENGYVTGGFGKFHQRDMKDATPADPRYLGFDEGVIAEDTKWGPWLDWVRNTGSEKLYELALGSTWQHNNRIIPQTLLDFTQKSRTDNYYTPIKSKSFWGQVYQSPMDANYTDEVFTTDKALEFLDKYKDDDKPFMMTVSYVGPHDPYDPPAPYATMFDYQDMPDPIPNKWEEEGITYLAANQEWLNFKSIKDDVDSIKKMRAHYHGKIRLIDDQIKRLVEYLKSNDLWNDTVIVFTADHGDMMGDHELIAKWIPHYDKSIRVPLIVAGGGVEKGVVDNIISSLDFFPSFLDIAGISRQGYPSLEGKSFEGYLYGKQVTDIWEQILIDSHDVESLITKEGMRFTKCISTEEIQIFDMKNDPQEINNLAKIKEYADMMPVKVYEMTVLKYRYQDFGALETRDYFGEYPAEVFINGCRTSFDVMPAEENGTLYYPAEKILTALGASYSAEGNTVTVRKCAKTLVFDEGAKQFTIAGKSVAVDSAFSVINEVMQAPVDFFEKYLGEMGYEVSFDENEKTLTITGVIA